MKELTMQRGLILKPEEALSASKGELAEVRRVMTEQPPENAWPIHDALDCYGGIGWAFQYPKDVGGGLTFNAIFQLPNNGKPPLGNAGDGLYGRETCVRFTGCDYGYLHDPPWKHPNGIRGYESLLHIVGNEKEVDGLHDFAACVTVPSCQMPKWASRFFWTITSVSVVEDDGKYYWVYKIKET